MSTCLEWRIQFTPPITKVAQWLLCKKWQTCPEEEKKGISVESHIPDMCISIFDHLKSLHCKKKQKTKNKSFGNLKVKRAFAESLGSILILKKNQYRAWILYAYPFIYVLVYLMLFTSYKYSHRDIHIAYRLFFLIKGVDLLLILPYLLLLLVCK